MVGAALRPLPNGVLGLFMLASLFAAYSRVLFETGAEFSWIPAGIFILGIQLWWPQAQWPRAARVWLWLWALLLLWPSATANAIASAGLLLWLAWQTSPHHPQARHGLLLMGLALLYAPGLHWLFVLFGEPLLMLDTWLAAQWAAAMGPVLLVQDNLLQVVSGHRLLVLKGCASLPNAALFVLVWLGVSRALACVSLRRDLVWIGLGLIWALLLNSARLALMAQSPEAYDWWHEGEGAVWYELTLWLGAAALIGLGVRRDSV